VAASIPKHVRRPWTHSLYQTSSGATSNNQAAKLIQERSGAYMTARTLYRERRPLMEHVDRAFIARPLRGSAVEEQQVLIADFMVYRSNRGLICLCPRDGRLTGTQLRAWQAVLRWERNCTEKSKDSGKRALFAYRQCVTNLRYIPEIW